MQLFWRHGIASSSYDDIVAATGLSRKTLYGYWPEKTALVHETLELYRATVLGAHLDALAAGGREGLEGYWTALAAETRRRGWNGCLLFRTPDELRDDPVVAAMVDEYGASLRKAIARSLKDAVPVRAFKGIDGDIAGWQAFAATALVSTLGATAAGGRSVGRAIAAGRAACGVPAKTAR